MSTQPQSNEMISTPTDSQELHDQKARQNNTIQNSHVNLTSPTDNASTNQKISGNSSTLSAGEHSGIVINKNDTTFIGLGLPTIKATVDFGIPTLALPNRPTSVLIYDDVNCRISNVRFKGKVYQGNSYAQHRGTVIFENCIFEETANIYGKAHFIGCTFIPVETGDRAVFNASVAANVYIIGCSRLNGAIYAGAGVTVIAETT